MSSEDVDSHLQKLADPQTHQIELAQEVGFEVEPFFMDQNGLEISAIYTPEPQEQQLNNSIESDQEILKFVFGEQKV